MHSGNYVLIALFSALLLTGGAVADECEVPDALLNAHLYDKALANYTDLLIENPQLICAQDGILAVKREQAINSYELGRAYENAGQVEDASKAYVAALDKNSSFGDAQKALARLNGSILTLAYSWYTFLRPYLEIIVAVVIVLLVLKALICQILPWIRISRKRSLDIGSFDKGATGLEIDKVLGAMVQESYISLGREGRMRVNLVEGPPNKLEIPTDANVTPYFKFISELINWLFPPNVITLSGYLQTPGNNGPGMTVTLVDNRTKKISDSCTIWQKEFDLETTPKIGGSIYPASYYNLAEPAAIWAHFQLGKLSKKNEFTMMGTNDWKSYAYFKSGVRWYLERKNEKAQQLYVESLGNDMKNWGTLLNLGRMEMEEGQYHHAFERLKMAKEKTISNEADAPEKSKYFPRNRTWYLATYNLALTYCYLYKRYESNLTKINTEIKTLIEKIDKSDNAIKKMDEMVPDCNLSMFGDEVKTLFESIQKAIYDLEIAVKISQCPEEKMTHDSIERIQKSVNTIREAIKTGQKKDEKLPNELNKIEKAINELKNNMPAQFKSIMSQAEEEANNLINTIKKAIGPQLAEQDAKKLAGTIREAIDAQQKNVVQVLKDRLSKTKEQAYELVETIIQKAIRPRQKNDDKDLKEFLELFYPMACIMQADTLLYVDFKERSDEARSIIQRIEPSSLTDRGRYNLACYYSILGENTETENGKRNAYRDSLYHLEYALERGGSIVEWAKNDPDLNGVRDEKETKEAFAKLVEKYGDQAEEDSSDLPLAGLSIIKEAYARQLKEQGIFTHCDLILKADTLQEQETLAKKLGISTRLLRRWALLADLMRIVGNTGNANLLEAADLGSLEALKKVSNPCELVNLLNQINNAQSLVKTLPAIEIVNQWVQEAKKIKVKVQ